MGPKKKGAISRWHYKRESAHVGSFQMIVGYFLTLFSQICSYCELYCVDTLSIFSPFTAAHHVVDLILNFLFLHCGYLGALVYLFISPKDWHLENLSYIKEQQDQAEAQTKNDIKIINSGSLF